jgi:dTDP-4-amino-4,6-dideoxygalactose transaminase
MSSGICVNKKSGRTVKACVPMHPFGHPCRIDRIADIYSSFFRQRNISFLTEPENSRSNYWLNTLIFGNSGERDGFLEYTNSNGVMTRPIWKLMNKLSMYSQCVHADLRNAEYLEQRVVNIPSSVRLK